MTKRNVPPIPLPNATMNMLLNMGAKVWKNPVTQKFDLLFCFSDQKNTMLKHKKTQNNADSMTKCRLLILF